LLVITNSAIGVYYYLRLIVTMFDRSAAEITIKDSASGHEIPGHWATVLSLGLIASMLLWLGGYPGPVIEFIRLVVVDLTLPLLQANY
jgi:NADH-quinone oxidoreductase subunit N